MIVAFCLFLRSSRLLLVLSFSHLLLTKRSTSSSNLSPTCLSRGIVGSILRPHQEAHHLQNNRLSQIITAFSLYHDDAIIIMSLSGFFVGSCILSITSPIIHQLLLLLQHSIPLLDAFTKGDRTRRSICRAITSMLNQ